MLFEVQQKLMEESQIGKIHIENFFLLLIKCFTFLVFFLLPIV